MNHEKRKNIIEAIGLLAIVVSLILVAWELRQVNVASKIAARDSITGGHLEFMNALIDENVLPMALWKLESGNGGRHSPISTMAKNAPRGLSRCPSGPLGKSRAP